MTIYAKIIAILVLCGSLFGAYEYIRYDAVRDYKLKQIEVQAQYDVKMRQEYDAVSKELSELKIKRAAQAKVIQNNTEKIVEREVYKNVCMDKEGLDLANEAIRGTIPSK